MKNGKKKILGLIPLVIFLMVFMPSSVINDENSTEIYDNMGNFTLKNSGYWYLTSAIIIDDTVPAQNWSTTAATYGWCSGYGNSTHPYVIEDVVMDLSGSGTCITIQNSNAYYIIENCSFFNAQYGIMFDNVSNGLINDTTIYNMKGTDKPTGTPNPNKPGVNGDDGTESIGIKVTNCVDLNIFNNNISNINGGKGGNGGAGTAGALGDVHGYDGGNAGNGGSAYGINVEYSNEIFIQNNYINSITSGSGGTGGNGGKGLDFLFVVAHGGNGGIGGTSGLCSGMYMNENANLIIIQNNVSGVSSGTGGTGGTGGAGGNGANGNGGNGGKGGNSNVCFAIYNYNITNLNSSLNIISSLSSGTGGAGGNGGQGYIAGHGGNGGGGGEGSGCFGINIIYSANLSILRNFIEEVSSGTGGSGGNGGLRGGTGATRYGCGGDGGYGGYSIGINITNCQEITSDWNTIIDITAENGGNGGYGGAGTSNNLNGGHGGNGGNGNFAYGFFSNNTGEMNITRNNFENIISGSGGNGGNGGAHQGTGSGGDGGNGGYGALGSGVYVINAISFNFNNNIISDVKSGSGGTGSYGGTGGNGGSGGNGGNGGSGGQSSGIFCENITNLISYWNEIEDITGGNGGYGGNAGNGLDSLFITSHGGDGGDGANADQCSGMYLNIITSIDANQNNISNIIGGNGGNGGDGGNGGNGGNGNAGPSGDSGDGSISYGIYFKNSTSIINSKNLIENVSGGDGGDGGDGGAGTATRSTDGSNGGLGGDSYGFYFMYQQTISSTWNNIQNMIGGDGGDGGNGGNAVGIVDGNGANGGNGGNGGLSQGFYYPPSGSSTSKWNSLKDMTGGIGGNGGNGGNGIWLTGNGGDGGDGGNGANSYGFNFENSSGINLKYNEIEDATSGIGGNGGSGGALSGFGTNGASGASGTTYWPVGIRLFKVNSSQIIQNIVSYCFWGFLLYYSYNNNFTQNLAINNDNNGIAIYYSPDNTVNLNNASYNSNNGIYFEGCNDYSIDENIACYNTNYGIYLKRSNNTFIIGNVLNFNGVGYFGEFECQNNDFNPFNVIDTYLIPIIIDNLGNGNFTWTEAKELLYWCHGSGSSLDPYIFENVNINAETAICGILVENSNNYFIIQGCNIGNASFLSNEAGVKLSNVTNGGVSNNDISDNNDFGILIENNCDNCVISDNVISNHNYGIFITDSSDCTASNNELSDHDYSMYIINSDGCTISDNELSDQDYGIYVKNSDDCTISGNSISSNLFAAIFLETSTNCNLQSNVMVNCSVNLKVDTLIQGTSHVMGTSNLVNGKSLYFYASTTGLTSTNFANAGQVILVSCSFSTISNVDVSSGTIGMILISSSGINMNDITANYNYIGIDLRNSDGNTISGSNLKYNYLYGILLTSSDSNTVQASCDISNNEIYGIYLYDSDDNTISGSTITNHDNNGIYIYESDSNTISGCSISDNNFGVYLYSSNYNTLSSNTLTSNQHGIYMDGTSGSCDNNGISDNTFSNNIESAIYLDSGHYITISGNTLTDNNNNGIFLDASNYVTISSNTIVNSSIGIYLDGSCNNTVISESTITHCTSHGIYINGGTSNMISFNMFNYDWISIGMNANSNYNTIMNNTITLNIHVGIWLKSCDNNNITGNSILIGYAGICLRDSDNNTISSNNIQSFEWFGLRFNGSDFNIINDNTITNNTLWGVFLWGTTGDEVSSDGNIFYNNYFKWNGVNAEDRANVGPENTWTYGEKGNYWDDYTGVDANFDSIGDIPYVVTGSAKSRDTMPVWESSLVITTPINNSLVGIAAPDFIIDAFDLNLDIMGYTFDKGLTNYVFTENGQVDQTVWEVLWKRVSAGETITIRFYFTNKYGYSVSKDIILVKYIPPDYSQQAMLILLIALISVASLSIVAGVFYFRHKKNKAISTIPAVSKKSLSKKNTKSAQSLSRPGELYPSKNPLPRPSKSDA